MKKQKQTKQQIDTIRAQLIEAIKCIDDNSAHLKLLDWYELYDLHTAINATGFTLVQTTNLADYYKTEAFCNANNLELINNCF